MKYSKMIPQVLINNNYRDYSYRRPYFGFVPHVLVVDSSSYSYYYYRTNQSSLSSSYSLFFNQSDKRENTIGIKIRFFLTFFLVTVFSFWY
mmetsp:Transcript_28312/g.32119  ORF Transcript_28312/g.32119 Transcript_28312/m.32119 type:complete len:91 (-) Transcript_28312:83-355(-)